MPPIRRQPGRTEMPHTNCLPRAVCHGPTGTRVKDLDAQRIASAEIPEFAALEPTTVIAHGFGKVLADIKAADLSEAEQRAQKLVTVRVILERMGTLDIREVLAVVDVLRAQCDGDTS